MNLIYKADKKQPIIIQETTDQAITRLMTEFGDLYGVILNKMIKNDLCSVDLEVAKEVKNNAVAGVDGQLTLFISIATEIFLNQLLNSGYANLDVPMTAKEIKKLSFAEAYKLSRSKS